MLCARLPTTPYFLLATFLLVFPALPLQQLPAGHPFSFTFFYSPIFETSFLTLFFFPYSTFSSLLSSVPLLDTELYLPFLSLSYASLFPCFIASTPLRFTSVFNISAALRFCFGTNWLSLTSNPCVVSSPLHPSASLFSGLFVQDSITLPIAAASRPIITRNIANSLCRVSLQLLIAPLEPPCSLRFSRPAGFIIFLKYVPLTSQSHIVQSCVARCEVGGLTHYEEPFGLGTVRLLSSSWGI